MIVTDDDEKVIAHAADLQPPPPSYAAVEAESRGGVPLQEYVTYPPPGQAGSAQAFTEQPRPPMHAAGSRSASQSYQPPSQQRQAITEQPRPPMQAAGSRNASHSYQPPSPQRQQQPQPSPAMRDAALGQQYQQQLLARCARGDHEVASKHGVMGILCAVFLFPIGLLCLLVDVERKCERCGKILD